MIEGPNNEQENAPPAQNIPRIVYNRAMLLAFRNHPLVQMPPIGMPIIVQENDQYDPDSPALGG